MDTKTDLEKLKSLFDDFKIGYKQYIWEDNIIVELMAGNQNVDGYAGFQSNYTFDKDERFIEVVICE